jgi:hypothetical protein
VAAGATATTSVFVVQLPERFTNGERRVRFRLSDGDGYVEEFPWRLLGPVGSADTSGHPVAEDK